MGVINILPKHVAELIAAGEVVERPSSVVKEAMENSIDAGANSVTVEIRRGGTTYIRITDNGCGISRDDIPKVFMNHATSKLAVEADLHTIGTLGFRGEAMASIAAVSKVELLTRAEGETFGSRCCISGGSEAEIDDAGCPKGTTLVVRDLFYNVPARMKFLKKDVTEANAIAAVIDRVALSHPEVSVRFIRDGKEALSTPGDGQLLSAIYAVYGKEFSGNMLPVDYTMHEIHVSGYICRPLAAKASRGMQIFYINGRFVKTRTAMAALEEAYKNMIMVGKFPSCVLHLEFSPYLVDVNVHPAKTEVRFANEKPIFEAVYYACKNALQAYDLREDRKKAYTPQTVAELKKESAPEQTVLAPHELPKPHEPKPQPVITAPRKPIVEVRNVSAGSVADIASSSSFHESPSVGYRLSEQKPLAVRTTAEVRSEFHHKELDVIVDDDAELPQPQITVKAETPEPQSMTKACEPQPEDEPKPKKEDKIRVIGEAFSTYILVEVNNELLMIDKHAAHERMLFNKLKESAGTDCSQVLLTPVSVTLPKEEYSALMQNTQLLSQVGFAVEDFGDGTVRVREMPLSLDGAQAAPLIEEIAANLAAGKQKVTTAQADWLYHSIACRAAIKAGDKTTAYEQELFVKKLLSDPDIRYCPHGRPVLISLSRRELEKRFGRV